MVIAGCVPRMTSARVGTYRGRSSSLLLTDGSDLYASSVSFFSDFFLVVAISDCSALSCFGLPLQPLDLLGIGQRLCYRRAESQATGSDKGATHQSVCGTQGHLQLSGVNSCELESIRVLSNQQIAIVLRCKIPNDCSKFVTTPPVTTTSAALPLKLSNKTMTEGTRAHALAASIALKRNLMVGVRLSPM